MGTFLVYILKSALCLAAFYLFYRLLLSRETFHRFNRMALLGVLALSAVVPLIETSTTDTSGVGQTMLTLEQWLASIETATVAEASAPVAEEAGAPVWPLILVAVYGAGVLFFLGRNMCSLFWLGQLLRGTQREDIRHYVPDAGHVWLLVHERDIAPFSWMRCIVIARRELDEDGHTILLHELAHIRCGHSWDLLLADVCIFLQWFNPAAWLLKQELQAVHEYEADEAVLRAGVNAKEYQLLLIKKAVGSKRYSMANSLNHSKLKKRITMMMKEKSNKWACAKYLYVLPLAAVAVAAFARPEVSEVSNQLSNVQMADFSQPAHAFSASAANSSAELEESVFSVVQQQPQFPGGTAAMNKFISEHIRYPQAAKEKGIEGRVIVQFTVDKTGQVRDAQVVRSIEPSLDAEAIRVVESMPLWKPGTQDGKPVDVRYTIPVNFNLDQQAKATSSAESDASNPAQTSVSYSTSQNGSSVSISYSSSVDNGDVTMVKAGRMSDFNKQGTLPLGIVGMGSIRTDMSIVADSILVVLDGEPQETPFDFSSLPADRINSITVLKEGESKGLYGDRAANGAILITTKEADAPKVEIEVSPLTAQEGRMEVDGVVVDKDGDPIAGAIVREAGEGKTNGVVSDTKGCFRLSVPKGARLEVSNVGFQTTRTWALPKLTVVMEAE